MSIKNVQAQLSKKHFIPPLTYAETGNANPENQYFYISTPSNKSVSYTIKQIGVTGSDITGFVSSTSPEEIFIGSGDSQLFVDSRTTSVVHNDKGYIIEADDVIYVSIRVLAGGGAQAGALVSKGASALGTTFRAGMYTNENPQDNYLNFISVMATENNTQVIFDDLRTGISIKNSTNDGSSPISITLNEGESYIIATNASESIINKNALIGALITSDKDIVTNIGSANGSFHNGGGRDYGIDQIVGVDKIGSEYIFVKGDGSDGWENVLIVSHEDDTTVKINGGNTFGPLNKGDYILIEGINYNTNGNMYIETSKPAFAYQGIGANNSDANQGLFFVPPLSCENRGKVDNIPKIESIGSINFTGGVTIVTNKNATVNINSLPISSFTTSGPFNVDGNTEYVTYKVTNLTGDISIESSGELYCAYFNQNGAASSGSFYSGFPSSPEINFDATVSTLGNCIPNITLEAANTELFDEFEWFFDDETGGGFVSTGNTDPTFIPTNPGRYQLVGKIICSGATFKSLEVPVSICPDDFDGDLIIDNLDDDIDNDGILNCDESIGNAALNIADINNPSIVFIDSSTNNSTTSIYTETEVSNTFSGDNLGDFESVINPATDTKLKYELKFAQNVNFKFTQNKTTDHVISNGEYFILKIGPNNKNITLLDPDDQLLIDTNFDGEFETGVTYISSSEIWFKYVANTTGDTSTFQFIANQVNQIDFKHQSTGISAASTFNGNIQLTCFSLDSDGDGIENMFDLDSDNDGIPDFYETAIDTDSDGILNYLDLDSDNDGIFDSTEAGHNLADTDLDGTIDNASTTIGINGLVDNLELIPDDKTLAINFTIIDTDSDGIFNFLELDSDNDLCFDVTEAGFTENGSGVLNATPFMVDNKGIIINNLDGYTTPNANYTTAAPITLNTTFNDVSFCENSIEIITIDSTADSFQWEVSTDGTTWNAITDNVIYNGTTTANLQVSNIPLTYNSYQYRVLLNRTGNSCTTTSNAITLTVNPLPIPKENPTELKQCDSDPDKQTTFNLTLAESNISDNAKDTFQYFATEVDANAGVPEVTDKTSYFVDTTGEAWVRTVSEFGCYAISQINLTVSYTPNEPYEETFLECDDFLDIDGNNTTANSDTDGITFFDFSSAPSQISIDPDIKIEFYETELDRTQSINEIQLLQNISQYRNNNIPNTTGNKFPIFYKLISKSNNDCSGLGQIFLQIKPVPLANTPMDINLCDDDASGSTLDGENIGINLRDNIDAILGATQTEVDYIVSFHTSENGANTNVDIITNDTNFTNATQTGFTLGDISEQTIYIRVQDRNATTQCFNDHVSFKIIVNPIPAVSNTITPFAVCDIVTPSDSDTRNRIAQNIDLTSKSTEILDGKINHRVAYYATQQDAENDNEISNPTVFQNITSETNFPADFNTDAPGIETIFFKIFDLGGNMCESVFATFQLLIYPEPNIPINISDYSDCDNTSDSFADDANGINGDITLKNKIPEILVNYLPSEFADFSVTFYTSLADAEAEAGNMALALDENIFENNANNQTIYVRVENTKNTPIACVHTGLFFNINIKPIPDFTVMGEEDIDTPQIVCLNDTPLTLEAENPAATYNYTWTDEIGTTLGTNSTLEVTSAGKYTVIATDQSPDACSRKRIIVVNESNIAILDESFITIIDESNTISSNDNISISIDTISNDLGPGDYQFALRNDDNGDRFPIIGFQDEPLFENLEGGIYTIIVNDKNGCSPDTELQISVIQFPKFFTPNGDGKNDTWVIKGANKTFYPNSSINIFNRFGKLVAQVPIDSQGWNGTYDSKTLPSDDYWFNIQLIPADTSKSPILKKGHFSLLRK
ncbi:T9SS type B sorting domain-containing protein [Polaribacter sp. SA4-12]|uniref:T9SS type B sorting domain-containing protein n=1 Tax=Polaribacter sp. SA4-12 TaxID=1312072 RepID=UPI0018DFA803|nr:T9SS type B sorting domain-containing protein [Polaribacter sp. SA4-12]